MPKHTLLRERAFVAKAMNDESGIARLRRQIVDTYGSCGRSLLKTSQKLGVSQMTLRRVAQELDLERELGIDRSRGEPVLLFLQARVAVESGDQTALTAIKKKVSDALKAAGRGGYKQAAEILRQNDVEGFWIHLDADVLDDAVMPAVEYHLADGLSWDELSAILRALMTTGQAVGVNVGIFNPAMDADGSIARKLVSCLVAGLR